MIVNKRKFKKWDKDKIYRTTKCFSPSVENGYPGGFPLGFLKWIKERGWWGQARAYLCSGNIGLKDKEAVTVDLNPKVKPSCLEDARKTSLPDNIFDLVIVDPPYTR